MTRRRQATAELGAPAEAVFARLDDQTRLAEHMAKPSLMMGGGRMSYAFDKDKGQAVGSHIRMTGQAFGFELALEEVVVAREPPRHKAWRTLGEPKLIVVGPYDMGFDLAPTMGGSTLTVWISYELPRRGLGRWLPALADSYAQWCVTRMADDAARAFGPRAPPTSVVRAARPEA